MAGWALFSERLERGDTRRQFRPLRCGMGYVLSIVAVAALAGRANGAHVPGLKPPLPPLLQSSSSHMLSFGEGKTSHVLVAGGNSKSKNTHNQDNSVAVTLKLTAFAKAVQSQLATIAAAACVVGSTAAAASASVTEFTVSAAKSAASATSKAASVVGEVGGQVIADTLKKGDQALTASGKVAKEALASAQAAAGELEDLVKTHPNEAAAVGVTFVAVAALKAVLASSEVQEVVLPATVPSSAGVSSSLTGATNATLHYFRTRVVPGTEDTLML